MEGIHHLHRHLHRRRHHRRHHHRLRRPQARAHRRRGRVPDPVRLVETSPAASATTPALAYNLSLTLTVRNPNWAITIKNKKNLEAAYTFDGQVFDRALLAEKGDKQNPRKTRVYHLTVGSATAGTAVPTLGNAGAVAFREQNATGFFEVEVKVTGKFSYTGRVTKCDLDATCPLKLQLAPPGTAAVVFQKVKCKLAKPKKYC
ncbi:unnamed protein product [Urochloa humidicola]